MKEYDLIVIGTGCGALAAEEAINHEWKVAIVEKGPLIGGTCLNWGCIPSKQLITSADSVMGIQEAQKLGITADVNYIDFNFIMNRMRESRTHSQQRIKESYDTMTEADFYYGTARFTGEHTLEVNGQDIRADNIIIATGARPMVPPIKGLSDISYLTNESLLELTEKPVSIIIIGGGYIAVEFAHFLAAMGTKVTMVEMTDRLVLSEEPEIADLLDNKTNSSIDKTENKNVRLHQPPGSGSHQRRPGHHHRHKTRQDRQRAPLCRGKNTRRRGKAVQCGPAAGRQGWYRTGQERLHQGR